MEEEDGVPGIESPSVLLNEDLLNRREGPVVDIQVRIIRRIFGFVTLQHFLSTIVGYSIFAWSDDEISSGSTPLIINLITWGLFLLAYVILVFVKLTKRTKNEFLVKLSLAIITICCMAGIGFISVAINDIIPIQFASILFVQSIVVFFATFINTQHVAPKKVAIAMSIFTVITWALGIYSFYEDGDWVGGIFLLLVSLIVQFYYVLQVYYSKRYNMGDIPEALVNVYVDPLQVVIFQIKKCRENRGSLLLSTPLSQQDQLQSIDEDEGTWVHLSRENENENQ